jgi:hypothetical protein
MTVNHFPAAVRGFTGRRSGSLGNAIGSGPTPILTPPLPRFLPVGAAGGFRLV